MRLGWWYHYTKLGNTDTHGVQILEWNYLPFHKCNVKKWFAVVHRTQQQHQQWDALHLDFLPALISWPRRSLLQNESRQQRATNFSSWNILSLRIVSCKRPSEPHTYWQPTFQTKQSACSQYPKTWRMLLSDIESWNPSSILILVCSPKNVWQSSTFCVAWNSSIYKNLWSN